MDRPALSLFVVATLLILAGCLGGDTPTAGPGVPTADGSPEGPDRLLSLPWTTSNGQLTNVSSMLANHSEMLVRSGFVSQVEFGGSVVQYAMTAERSNYAIRPSTESILAAWANDTVAYVRQPGPTFSRYKPDVFSTAQLTGANRLEALLTAGRFVATDVILCGDQRCIVYRATESHLNSYRNFSGVVRVRMSGLVRSFSANYTRVSSDSRTDHRYAFALERRGNVSVARPPWLGAAIAATADD